MAQIHELTMIGLAAAIRVGELSPVTVTDHYLRWTQELNHQVGRPLGHNKPGRIRAPASGRCGYLLAPGELTFRGAMRPRRPWPIE